MPWRSWFILHDRRRIALPIWKRHIRSFSEYSVLQLWRSHSMQINMPPMQYSIKIATLLLQMQPTSLHQNFVPPFTQSKNQSVIWIPKHLRLLWQTKQNVWLKRIQWPKLQFRYLSILLWKSSRRAPACSTEDKIEFVLHQPSPSLLMIKKTSMLNTVKLYESGFRGI